MKKISRRSFMLASGLLGAAAALTACGGSSSSTGSASSSAADTTETSGGTYTYRTTMSDLSTWSATDAKTTNEYYVREATATGLYSLVMNSTKDGYEIVPEMAAEMPEDVTAQYAGSKYGVPSDATSGYAFKVKLREDAVWEDGTGITADDYIYSIQQHLNPDMKNYSAASWYRGTTPIANAESYYLGADAGKTYSPAYETVPLGTAFADAGVDLYFNMSQPLYLFAAYYGSDEYQYSVADMYGYGEAYWPSFQLADGSYLWDKYSYDTYIPVTEEVAADLDQICANWGYDANSYMYMCFTVEASADAGETTWDDVGVIKDDDYTITLIFTLPLTMFNFEYATAFLYLLNEELYEANKQETGGVVKSSYGTAVDKYSSYGPYRVESFQADKEIHLTKNDKWYGYSDGEHDGQYMTTDIVMSKIDEYTTQLSMFLQGNLEVVGLSSDMMTEYANSDFAYFEPSGYSYFYVLNSDIEKLRAQNSEGENHCILSYIDFRKGVSWAIDRSEYVASITPASNVSYALLNDLYIYDVETGASYRDSDAAKQVLCEHYEADNVDDITGYDIEKAAEYIQAAYDQCLADGNISDTDTVVINFHTYGSTADDVKMVNFFEDSLVEAAKGTSLEGRIKVNLVEDVDYTTSLRSGLADMAYGGWGSYPLTPYSDFSIYIYDDYRYDTCFDTHSAQATINVDGQDITMGLADFYEELASGTYASADAETKCSILAGLELRVLENYTSIPLYNATSASLYSQRLVLGSETYVNSTIGYASGVRYLTYTMNDDEWEEYCAANNNQLDYQ